MATHEQTLIELDAAYERIEQLHREVMYLVQQIKDLEWKNVCAGKN